MSKKHNKPTPKPEPIQEDPKAAVTLQLAKERAHLANLNARPFKTLPLALMVQALNVRIGELLLQLEDLENP